MTTLRRLAAAVPGPFLAIATAIVLAMLAVACGSSVPATTGPSSRATPTASAAASPRLTPVPGGQASPVLGPTVGPPSTTDTEFGPIFDALPPSFPTLPGQEPGDAGGGATSGSYAVNMSVADASRTIQAGLTAAGWSVDAGSPLEDGSVVLEARHAPAGCRTEVRFTPLSGTVIMSVLYGASCPFS